MNREEGFAVVVNLLARYMGCSVDAIHGDTDLAQDLGLDSLDAVELLIALEDATGLEPDIADIDELPLIATVDGVVELFLRTANRGAADPLTAGSTRSTDRS